MREADETQNRLADINLHYPFATGSGPYYLELS